MKIIVRSRRKLLIQSLDPYYWSCLFCLIKLSHQGLFRGKYLLTSHTIWLVRLILITHRMAPDNLLTSHVAQSYTWVDLTEGQTSGQCFINILTRFSLQWYEPFSNRYKSFRLFNRLKSTYLYSNSESSKLISVYLVSRRFLSK